MNKLYVITRNGDVNEDFVADTNQAMSIAEERSGRGEVTIVQTTNNKVYFYENGSIANPVRKAALCKELEDILTYKMSRNMK